MKTIAAKITALRNFAIGPFPSVLGCSSLDARALMPKDVVPEGAVGIGYLL
jgi:hypothetical protein